MRLAEHADRSEAQSGIRAEDIHRWIDGFFDAESYREYLQTGRKHGFNPYAHRKYRHTEEALQDALREFEGKYTAEQIKAVFECHIRDDYGGIIPRQEDFSRGRFEEKYHHADATTALERILSRAEMRRYFQGRNYPDRETNPRKLSASFYWRIVWPAVIAALLFALFSPAMLMPLFRNGIMKQKRTMIRELTTTAASAIESFVHLEQRGEMRRDEAQRLAAAEISELRYGTDLKDYFWITDMKPHMVMHPYRPELVGQELTDYKDREDKSGKHLFTEFVDIVEQDGEGYLEYLWQWMDDPNRAEPKLSYVKGIPEWDWIIGTGIYIHDVKQEIDTLSRKLMVADAGLAVLLCALMLTVVLQSRRIELDRKNAEAGLVEAKERYRALVEASREGSLLEIGGEAVYANDALQQLTGYGEVELLRINPWELIPDEGGSNQAAREHLQAVYTDKAASRELQAQLLLRNDQRVDVTIATSRVFLSEQNGHIITFREISRGPHDTLDALQRRPAPTAKEGLPSRIKQSQTPAQAIELLKQLPQQAGALLEEGRSPQQLRALIAACYDATLDVVIHDAQQSLSLPDIPFAFLSLGSNARREMTLFSDQDNALIFADPPGEQLAETRRAFLALGDRVCTRLNQAGLPFCTGGLMAANPSWCLSLSEWRERFAHWLKDPNPQSLREINIFLDFRSTNGNLELLDKLHAAIAELSQANPAFFSHFARDCLAYKPPLGVFGRLRTERRGGSREINIKQCIQSLETFARIYALKHNITQPGTLERLQRLHEAGVLQEDALREFGIVFNHLWRLRFVNQLSTRAELSAEPDALDIQALTELEREQLQTMLSRIELFQTRLNYDFLGT